MANQVYANNMEISCKAAAGKSICAFPDVCFTPPENPATPPGVPVPYPNTGVASDTTDGSRTVKISGEEIMLKNKSYFKRSTGDEAGCATKKGLITSVNRGKVYFTMWSMDVKVEGENVVRHLDMTTHNHACPTANEAVPWPHIDEMAFGNAPASCAGDAQKVKDNCPDGSDPCPGALSKTVTEQREPLKKIEGGPSRTEQAANIATADADTACVNAMRCILRPYSRTANKGGCCDGQTPHHIPPKSMMGDIENYSESGALCVCLEGASQHVGSHGKNHAAIDYLANQPGVLDENGKCSLGTYNNVCAKAVAAQCGCNAQCIEDQLNNSMKGQQDKEVKHWQSNSKQLNQADKQKLDNAFGASKSLTNE